MDKAIVSEVMRYIGSRPKQKRFLHTCPVCGRQFPGTKRAVYCSDSCQCKAYRQRKKARAQE